MSTATLDAQGKEYGEWDSMSAMYENAVARLTGTIVSELVQWTNDVLSLSSSNTKAMDNGCGTGSLSSVIKDRCPSVPLLATDYSQGMIDKVQKAAEERGWSNFKARVQDARDLSSVECESLTHVFSSFMICLAPDPDQIAGEMLRVLQTGGILGLTVWGDPNFGYWEEAWTKACRELDPSYKPKSMMDPEWTYADNVERGLTRAGFKDVKIRSKHYPWRWESVKPALKYFFNGHNPKLEELHRSWTERGWRIDIIKPMYERKLVEAFGQTDGSLEGPVSVCLAIARKW